MEFIKNRKLKNFIYINLGVALMAFAYTFFVDSNELIIGGVGGIATLLKNVFDKAFSVHIDSSVFIFVLNMLLLLVALLFVGKDFFYKTLYASLIYPVYVFIFEQLLKLLGSHFIVLVDIRSNLEVMLPLANDLTIRTLMVGGYLLFILFASVISGLGLGLALKKGASTGGVDIIQQVLLKYLKIPFSVSLFIIDGLIVFGSFLYFRDFYIVLYGFLFIYISGKVLDSVAFSGFNSRAVKIITKYPDEVKQKIYEVLARGVTEIYAKSGYEGREFKKLVCVMSNSEFYKIKSIILEIDPKAFIYVMRASEVHGEGFSYDSE